MHSVRWAKLKDIFHEALELPREKRAAFLDAECAGDAELRRRVEELLTSADEDDAGPGPTIGVGQVGGAAHARPAESPQSAVEGPGSRIGPYKLLESIGEGGFGSVFLAEQDQPVRRRVALKIIKAGMDTRRFVARFEAERQALALMDHPNIARVLDGGATEQGRPFFVMELVRGEPITRYCDESKLNVRERLALFRDVCQAVQHAHQKGIIHRDIKPSNVLVGTVDGRPHAKVIDFGIAKTTDQQLTDKTVFTGFQQMLGTPAYMSPEQASGSIDLDTRTDVYSLGVLLYELLTGTTPFDLRQLRSVAEIQRVIREAEPPPPSTRLGSLRRVSIARDDDSGKVNLNVPQGDKGSSAAAIALQRRTDEAGLQRELRGEPDWIVLKSLEKDRARRYESVGALAADVERFLRDEPIIAGPPSRWYRFTKLVRRNRLLFAATASVAVALVLGLTGTVIGLLQAVEARKAETQQRERAELSEHTARDEARRASEMSAFLKQTLLSIDPVEARGMDTTLLRKIMDQTRRRLDTELASQPRARAEMYLLVGQVSERIGRSLDAEQPLRSCLSILDTLGADEPAGMRAAAMQQLASTLDSLGRIPEAESIAREAMKLDEGLNARARAELRRVMANVLRHAGKFTESRRFAEQALEQARSLDPAEPHDVATSMRTLALVLSDLQDHRAAEQLLNDCLALEQPLVGENDLRVCLTLEYLAIEQYEQGHVKQAEQGHRRVLEMQQRILGNGHPRTANTKASLAITLMDQQRFDEARPLLEEAIAATRRAQGDNSRALANHLCMYAGTVEALGEQKAAVSALEEALAILTRSLPDEHPAVLNTLDRLGRTLNATGEHEAGLRFARRGIAGASVGNPGVPRAEAIGLSELAAGILGDWSESESRSGRTERGLELCRQAVAEYEQVAHLQEATLSAGDWKLIDTWAMVGLNLTIEAEMLSRDESQRSVAVERLNRAELLVLAAAERFQSSDSDIPEAFRPFYIKRACERAVKLFEVWQTVEPTPERARKLEVWRNAMQEADLKLSSPNR